MALTEQQALWFELMQFYIREAWLLDERRYKEWLDLFTDDVLYFMPRRKNVPRRELHRERCRTALLLGQERPPHRHLPRGRQRTLGVVATKFAHRGEGFQGGAYT